MEPSPIQTIVLCAGELSPTIFPLNTSRSVAMLPVNGKPVIGWILDDLFKKKILNVVIVAKAEDQQLRSFVAWAYGHRMQILFAFPTGQTILHSLQAGLEYCDIDCPTRIILGDTLIRDPFDGDVDFVYTGRVEDTRRWCLVTTADDGSILEYIDKPSTSSPSRVALAGYYHFMDGNALRTLLTDRLQRGDRELSDLLRCYGPIRAVQANEWYDFGHIDNLADARRQLLQPRFFNSLVVNPILNTITKTSQNNDKLQNELDWYLSLPETLKVLAPRILHHQVMAGGEVHLIQEYYGYSTLSELYVYGNLDIEVWETILRKVIQVHLEFLKYPSQLDPTEIETMYLAKTQERLRELVGKDHSWDALLALPSIEYNQQVLQNFHQLLPALRKQFKHIAASAAVHIIHGDFCLSNILFDVNHQIIRLIDPRGYFGRKGIYGDPRYDIAKLRHSISGLYDFILADLFLIEEFAPGKFSGQILVNELQNPLAEYFDDLLISNGYSLDEIRLIEGLLFVSMLPYHQGFPARQKMFFLTGLALLNEVLT